MKDLAKTILDWWVYLLGFILTIAAVIKVVSNVRKENRIELELKLKAETEQLALRLKDEQHQRDIVLKTLEVHTYKDQLKIHTEAINILKQDMKALEEFRDKSIHNETELRTLVDQLISHLTLFLNSTINNSLSKI